MKFISIIIQSLMFVVSHQSNLKEFTDGNNQFTAAVYKELLHDNKENFIVSPLSAEIILALVQTGAKGETAKELQKSLHLPSDNKSSFKNVLTSLNKNKQSKLYTANKIYAKQDLSITNAFKQLAKDTFGAELENIDFTKAENAANTINKWVEQQTNNKIQNLIDPKILQPATSLILINTMYFKAKWATTFEQYSTRKADFYKSAKNIIKVDSMYMHNKLLDYYECSKLKAKFLKKDFEDEKISMVIVLPNERDGLEDVEKNAEKVFASHKFQETRVNLMLPKFKIETKTLFTEIMKKLGVKKAFLVDEADFSGIVDRKDSLIISEIVQKAFIDVNEQGVEVAVATDLSMLAGASLQQQKPKEFIVDHPFMYYIKFEDVILFAGRVSAPTY